MVQSDITINPPSLPINKRAWTFQERVLSSRVLLYANGSLVWQCPYESMESERRKSNLLAHGHARSESILLDLPRIEDPPSFDALSKLYDRWTNLVSAYSCRRLRYKHDRLSAISGIAARFAAALSGHQYSAGSGMWQGVGIHNNQ